MLRQEHEIVPYQPTVLTGRRVLVFSPHPDDETIGCGGTLALHTRAGDPVKVIFLTNGAMGDFSGKASREEYIELRRKEAIKACQILGIEDIEFWGYEDRGLAITPRVANRICDLLRAYHPELIYLPSPLEYHPDHRAAAVHLREALRLSGLTCMVAFCEIGAPIGVNCLVDITGTKEKKIKAIKSYTSQLKERPYLEIALSLNRFRTLTLADGSTHAEGFSLWPSGTVRQFDPLLLAGPKTDRLSVSLSDAGPLVSIIVRTRDRPEVLGNALHSIAEQTYTNIEVVLVNDGKEDVKDSAMSIIGQVPLTYVHHHKTLGRAAAANSGLKASEGSFLNFLDDDDIIYPEHVEVLVAKLLSTNNNVAYSGVKSVFYEGPPSRPGRRLKEEMVFNHPFDSDLLLFENYIPFMSLMFSKDVFSKVKNIDEDMDLFEDWDFLVRVSRHYDFLHVDKVTAEYRFYGANSVEEAHRANYSYDKALANAFERFRPFMTGQSWLKHLSGGLVGRLKMDIGKLEKVLALQKETIDGYQGHIGKLEEELDNRAKSIEGYQDHVRKLEQIIDNFKAIKGQLEGEVALYRDRLEEALERHLTYRLYQWLKRLIPRRHPTE